jgi:hypothetical protein
LRRNDFQNMRYSKMTDHTQVDSRNSAPKTPRGRPFSKGNPGKQVGTRSRYATLVARLASDDVKEIVAAISEKAREGDVRAAELLLRYCAPLPRSRLVKFPLPPLNTLGDVTAATAAVLQGVAAGQLTIEEGDMLANILERHGKAINDAEIEHRLAALEADAERRAA